MPLKVGFAPPAPKPFALVRLAMKIIGETPMGTVVNAGTAALVIGSVPKMLKPTGKHKP